MPARQLADGVFFEDVAAASGDAAAAVRTLALAGTHALAAVPLPTPQGVAGVLGVVRARPVEFSETRRFLLRAIGDELAGSIERSELADEAGEHRRLAEAVLREMADGVVVLDADGRCRVCNPAAVRLLGMDPTQVLGALATAVLPLPAETIDVLRARDGGVATPLLAEGPGRELALTAGPFGAGAPPAAGTAGGGAILLLRDLTDVTAAERAKQDFVSMVGHELRTPLR
ncbi:MAG: PAS domain-containing protein [Dehalococcoidia bacterium]|nr:PAS domain-containing protein [Dehalococcoidia bacterium]